MAAYLQSSTGVSLVFASQYAGNPASIMGHTFLKFNDEGIVDNLRPSINYGASIDEDIGPVSYIYNGLLGGFFGHYGLESYFQKKKEYRDIENRDLWEYDLDLTAEELARLKANIVGELQNQERRYYFLDENCSFELIRQIEMAKGTNQFTQKNYFYVLPHETIRWLDSRGYIKERRFIPSLRRQLLESYEKLNGKEKQNVLSIWQNKHVPGNTSAAELDTLLFRLQMEEYRSEGELPEDRKELERQTLLLRAQQAPTQITASSITTPVDPSTSHRPHVIRLIGDKDKTEVLLSPGIHHLFQDASGFAPNTELSFLETLWEQQTSDPSIYLNEFNLMTFTAWSEYSRIDPKFSWRAKLFSQREALALSPWSRTERLELASGYGFQIQQIHFSILLGGLIVHDSSQSPLDGSRLQVRLLGSYQYRRLWRTFLEAHNSSQIYGNQFEDLKKVLWNLTYLHLVRDFDLGVEVTAQEGDKSGEQAQLSVVGQYSF